MDLGKIIKLFKSQIVDKSRPRYAENSEIGIQLILKPNHETDFFEIEMTNGIFIYLLIYSLIFIFIFMYSLTHNIRFFQ